MKKMLSIIGLGTIVLILLSIIGSSISASAAILERGPRDPNHPVEPGVPGPCIDDDDDQKPKKGIDKNDDSM